MAVRCGDRTIIQILTTFVFYGGKLLDDYERHLIELIIVVHLINNCVSIDCVLEKRCVKFVWNLFKVKMYYLEELLDIPCTIVTPPLVKMLGIVCINIRLYMMIGLIIFLIYLTEFIIKLKILHSWMVFELSGNCARHVTGASYNLLIATKHVT